MHPTNKPGSDGHDKGRGVIRSNTPLETGTGGLEGGWPTDLRDTSGRAVRRRRDVLDPD